MSVSVSRMNPKFNLYGFIVTLVVIVLMIMMSSCSDPFSEPKELCTTEVFPQDYYPSQTFIRSINESQEAVDYINNWISENPEATVFPALFSSCAASTDNYERSHGNAVTNEELAQFWLNCVRTSC